MKKNTKYIMCIMLLCSIIFNQPVYANKNFDYTETTHTRAMITFSYDDGWLNNYELAYPLHEKYNIPASFNIIGKDIDNPSPQRMTKKMIKQLSDKGHEIASHSYSHPVASSGMSFDQLSNEATRSEATKSRDVLINLGIPRIESFVVPGSRYTSDQALLLSDYYMSIRS